MLENDAPIIIADTLTFTGWLVTEQHSPTRSGLGAPVKVKGEIIGFLWLSSTQPHTFHAGHAARLQTFANYAAIAIENAQLYEKVQKLALTDALTGIYNRTFFETELARLESCREYPISIIIADLDNMKTTNDRLGHPAGDELLRDTVSVLQSVFRASDIVARIGGDEFAMLLPQTEENTARQIITRIEAKLAEHNRRAPRLPILLSFGEATAQHGQLMETFVLADQRMYANKTIHKAGKAQSEGINQ
jgi:diguanylate cyclase (GGDEF)-like protein